MLTILTTKFLDKPYSTENKDLRENYNKCMVSCVFNVYVQKKEEKT